MSATVIKYGNPEKGVVDGIEKSNIELLSAITSQAKTLCTTDTGLLKNSIMWKTVEQSYGLEEGKPLKQKVKAGSGIVGTATEYAGYVEFGTRRMKAQPFLRPAISEVFSQASNIVKQASIQEMKKALSKGKKVIG